VLPLLHFVNDVFDSVDKQPFAPTPSATRTTTAFRWRPMPAPAPDALGVVAARVGRAQAETVADEIARLLEHGETVRDRTPACGGRLAPGDIAVLFRTREGHRLIEQALSRRRVPFYVYKGLGFFDADEIKDVLALLGLPGGAPSRHCGRRRCCARGSSACRMRR
jgi:superfamily I DNA/RNA helicase